MDYKAGGVVEGFGGREGSVPAFVGEFPGAGEEEALRYGIGYPGADADAVGGQELDLCGQGKEDADAEEVSEDVEEGEEGVSLETVRWDGVVDLLHGVRGRCEEWLLSILD